MRNIVWISLTGIMALSLGAAEQKAASAVKSAADKLAAKPNYSWTSVNKPAGSEEGFRMTAEGKTEKGGGTLLTISFGDRTVEAALKGDRFAVKTDQEWQAADELEGRSAWMARRYREFKLPAAEAQDLAEKAKELKAGPGGVYSGDLTEQGVKEMFARWGRREGQAPQATDVKGWVKFWVQDGLLTKYEFNQQGKFTVGQDQREMDINRTTTVEIKDVGTTRVSLPEGAKQKLE